MPFSVQAHEQAITPADRGDGAESEDRLPATSYPAADEWEQEKQVRLTAQRILVAHLRRPQEGQGQTGTSPARYWDNARVDLIGATLIDFDFVGCVVIGAGFSGASFSGNAWFSGAAFHGDAGFSGAAFHGDAEFSGAAFHGGAGFSGAAFHGNALFSGTAFHGGAYFNEATFNGIAGFDMATFHGDAGFTRATFHCTAQFSRVTFAGAWFDGATFNGTARFGGAGAERGPDSIRFSKAVVKPHRYHVWPEGWQLQDDGTGGLTVNHISGVTSAQTGQGQPS